MTAGQRLWLALAAGGLMAAQPAPQSAAEIAAAKAAFDAEQRELEAQMDLLYPPEDPPLPEPIVRGSFVSRGEAPWQIEIYTTVPISAAELAWDKALADDDPEKRFYAGMSPTELDHVCGGVLIAEDWALSAAHCFVNRREEIKPLATRRARLGSNYLPSTAEMAIERVIVHGDYRRAGNKRHDIALIKLRPDAATDRETAAIAKPIAWRMGKARALADDDILSVTGWGVTGEREAGSGQRDVDGRLLRISESLMQADLRRVPDARCEAVPSYRETVWDGVLCVAGDETEQDSCQGDSGGPLRRGDLLIGLVSTGYGCGLKSVPALYTRVRSYEGWIDAVMAASKAGVATRCAFKRRWFTTRLVCDD